MIKLNSGMTLIELIVSLGIMVMILAAILSFYWAGIKSWFISENQMEVLQNARIALEWISRDLKMAVECNILSSQKLSIKTYSGDEIVYEKVGNQLLIVKNGNNVLLADYIDVLNFTQNPNTGVIEIELTVKNGSYEVNLSTKIAARKINSEETEEA